mmetsp:Transcript_47921/g.102604  ORF Transcript_47921/g.102604 Transcript_47921/m.102604 type:complete len:196 (+) Transcript_47921:99-686(+)
MTAAATAAAMPVAAAPGRFLGIAEDFSTGRGTYAEQGSVFASVTGEVHKVGDDQNLLEVLPERGLPDSCTPEVGSTVIARVVRMTLERAECIIVAIGETVLSEKFRGVIRKQDVRFFEVDKVGMVECFRVGDFVRAQVLALGDLRSYVLSTASSDSHGVILAKSQAGGMLEPVSWQLMRCSVSGALEMRKVAKPA